MNDFTRNEIIRRWYERQSMRGIAADLQVARETVKRVVEQNGGEVRLQSEVGRGARFSFSIPATLMFSPLHIHMHLFKI